MAGLRPDTGPRREVIGAVTTPLKFFVLSLLIIEALLGGMAIGFKEERPLLVWAIIGFLAGYTLMVAAIAVLKPEALSGQRPWQRPLAQKFAFDLVMSLEGAMANLNPRARTEAWATVADVITSDEEVDPEYLAFCEVVAGYLRRQNEVRDRLNP